MFVVYTYGDSGQELIGICPTLELADALRNKIQKYHEFCVISEEVWNILCNEYYEASTEDCDAIVNEYRENNPDEQDQYRKLCFIAKKHPEFTIRSIEKAHEIYDNYEYCGTVIEEVPEFKTIEEINEFNY